MQGLAARQLQAVAHRTKPTGAPSDPQADGDAMAAPASAGDKHEKCVSLGRFLAGECCGSRHRGVLGAPAPCTTGCRLHRLN
jgi:hypothetical protein